MPGSTDKGQIYQLIQGFNRGDRIYALVAPAFINQFPGLASTGKLKATLKAVGFYDVVEVAMKLSFPGTSSRKSCASSTVHRSAPMATSTTS